MRQYFTLGNYKGTKMKHLAFHRMSLTLIAFYASDAQKAVGKPMFVTIPVPSVPLGDWDWTHWPAMVRVMGDSVQMSTAGRPQRGYWS